MSKVIIILVVIGVSAFAAEKQHSVGRRRHSDYDSFAVRDLPCDHEGLFEFENDVPVDHDWVKKVGEKCWHYVAGNRAHARDITRVLTAEYPEGYHFFQNACIKMVGRTEGGFTISGFNDQKAIFECIHINDTSAGHHNNDTTVGHHSNGTATGRRDRNCRPTKHSSHPYEAADRGADEAMAAWSDNKKYALFIRCTGHGHRSGRTAVWSLRSTEAQNVDEETLEKVLKFIHQKGFNDEHTVIYPMKNCSAAATP